MIAKKRLRAPVITLKLQLLIKLAQLQLKSENNRVSIKELFGSTYYTSGEFNLRRRRLFIELVQEGVVKHHHAGGMGAGYSLNERGIGLLDDLWKRLCRIYLPEDMRRELEKREL